MCHEGLLGATRRPQPREEVRRHGRTLSLRPLVVITQKKRSKHSSFLEGQYLLGNAESQAAKHLDSGGVRGLAAGKRVSLAPGLGGEGNT